MNKENYTNMLGTMFDFIDKYVEQYTHKKINGNVYTVRYLFRDKDEFLYYLEYGVLLILEVKYSHELTIDFMRELSKKDIKEALILRI